MSTNLPPVAVASVVGGKQVVNPGEEATLSGLASNDPDGSIVSYNWVQTDGNPHVSLTGSSTALASFSVPVTGLGEQLVFQLTVQDNAGAQSSDDVAITVNVPPTADAGPDQFAYGSSPVQLSGAANDVDGSINSHLWEQTSGTEVALSGQATPTITFNAPSTTETLTFRYTVTDNDGAKHSDSVNVYLSRIVFSDSFNNSSSLNNWVFVGETGIAQWLVTGGALRQLNNVDDNTFLESYHIGTFAYLNNPAFNAGNAFRLNVDVTPLSNEGHDVGIMFPYSTNNYYRVSMSGRYGFTRFEKWSGDRFSTLAVNARGYVPNVTIPVTIEISGNTIIFIVDGDPLFAATGIDIQPGSMALYCQDRTSFDNVVISENSPQPLIAISSPLAHSIALTSRYIGAPLLVEAVVLNKPIGGSVVFILDDGPEITSTDVGNLHRAWFADVPAGEHEITAILKDANGKELSRDTNSTVGVGGNYIIAVGDSITSGFGDLDPSNNSSEDQRIIANQGFAAPLNNKLTDTYGLPHIIFNEGIPGDRSIELEEDRIDSILERHPRANTMLLLIGTNDAGSATPPILYKDKVEIIVNTALTDVSQVYIARIPPRYTNSGDGFLHPANSRITEYNPLIADIVANPSDNIFPGPDFYGSFLDRYGDLYAIIPGAEFPDGIHFNDAGYQVIADAWHDILSQTP